jgi:hypothetical protein
MLRGLVPVSFGVTVAVQVAEFPPLGASVQIVNTSLASGEESAIVPPGFDAVPVALVSVTVTVIVLAWPTSTEAGLRLMLVEVVRGFTVSEEAPLLVACTLSFGLYVPVMFRGLAPTSPGVMVTVVVQLEVGGFDPLFAERVHGLPLIVSLPSGDVNATVPAGFDCVPVELSVTMTVIVLACPTRTEFGVSVTLVEVPRPFTARGDDPLLVEWTLSLGV